MIATDSTQQVVKKIFQDQGRPLNRWADLPAWDQKATFLPDSDEGKALLATTQVKTIFWMLIQHRRHLGKKAIKKICVFKDDVTGTNDHWYPDDKRGPSFYVQVEDVE